MKRSLKTGYIVFVFFLWLIGLTSTVHAAARIDCPATSPGVVGTYYTYTFAGNGKSESWNLTSGSLPPGLNLSTSTGVLSGTPITSGSYTFTVTYSATNGTTTCTSTIVILLSSGCAFIGTSTGSILFDIDPTSAGPIYNSITTPVYFLCALGTTYTITYTSAQTLSGTKNSIPFTLSLAASGTSGTTNIPLLTTTSQILAANYRNAYAETDNSATNVTINWTGNTGSPIYAMVNASGTVINACSVSGSPALAFGTIDAVTNAGGATATVTSPTIMCTMGCAVTVTNDGGLNYSGTPRLNSGTNYISYNLGYTSSLSGAGGSADIGGSGTGHLAMGATIPAGSLDNARAGTYNDVITLTISY